MSLFQPPECPSHFDFESPIIEIYVEIFSVALSDDEYMDNGSSAQSDGWSTDV